VNQRSNAAAGSSIVSISGSEMTLNFSLAGFELSKIEKFEIIGQEYDSKVQEIDTITSLPPSTYYLTHQQQTVGSQQSSYRYHRYLIDSITPADIISKRSSRKRREITLVESNLGSFIYRVGNTATCRADQTYCNGPLIAGAVYRFQVKAYYKQGDNVLPVEQPMTGSGTAAGGGDTSAQIGISDPIINVWVIGLIVLGALFWLSVLAIAIILCYKRRYLPEHAYSEGVITETVDSGYVREADNEAYYSPVKESGYVDVDTIKLKKIEEFREEEPEPEISQTHGMVIVDSPPQTPEPMRREYETRSADIKFTEEAPEWDTMDIQLRIDPTGKQDPIITRRERPVDDEDETGSSGSVTGTPTGSVEQTDIEPVVSVPVVEAAPEPVPTPEPVPQPEYDIPEPDYDVPEITETVETTTITTTTYERGGAPTVTTHYESHAGVEPIRIYVEEDGPDESVTRL